MWMGIAAVVALATTGCAQVFGLDETDKDPDIGVSLAMVRQSIGATVVAAPQDLTGRVATYLVADEADPSGLARIVADQPAPDLWTADIKRAPVQFDLPDFPAPVARQFDFASQAVVGLFSVLEHPDPAVGDPNAMLTVSVTLDTPFAATEAMQLFTLGSWNVRGLEAPVVGAATLAPPAFAFSSMTSITGRPHEAITADDAAVVLRYVGNDLTGVADIPPFAQTGNDTLTGTMVANAHDQTLAITVDQAAIARRYTAVRPAMANLSMQWALRAAPGFASGEDRGPLLHAAAVAAIDPPAISVPFGNPFTARAWQSVLTWFTQTTRTFTPAGQLLPATLIAQMFERHAPSAGLVLALPAGLPELISLDDVPLSLDGIAVPAPSRALVASFITNPAANTLYQLQLFELVPNAAMTELVHQLVYAAAGSAPRFTLPPELFAAGHHYTLRAIAIAGGHPAIADGDLTQRELPLAVSFMESGVFTVTP